jgi:outer membrane receptor protein involved in Fe transport
VRGSRLLSSGVGRREIFDVLVEVIFTPHLNMKEKTKTLLTLVLLLAMQSEFLVSQDEDDEVYELSPFVVETDQDEGYQASATLAGTRVRTDLKDIASSISVVTKQFMKDTGATSNEVLLNYTTNTEVGGVYGNFAGTGNTQGISDAANLTSPNANTRVRGLEAADNTRDYFITDIPWDGYIVDRVDLQRGPNSILFGVGSPAGIINAGTIIPTWKNGGEFETRISKYGSYRNSLDYNRVIIDNLFAVRIAALNENQKYQQKPAFERDDRAFITAVLQPDWFGKRSNTTIRVNYEHGEIEANRPRTLTPIDQITPWWTDMNKGTYDPAWTWENYVQLDDGNASRAAKHSYANNPWLGNAMDGSMGAVTMFYDNNSETPSIVRQPAANEVYGIGPDGSIDRGIGSFTFSRLQSIAGFNEYTRNTAVSALAQGLENPYPCATKNFYKDIHISDPGIFDFYNNLIDGDTKKEWSDWDSANFSVVQTFFGNRLGFEFVYDYQDYTTGSTRMLDANVSIGIDINSHTNMIPTQYPTAIPLDDGGGIPRADTVVGGDSNPNAGRAYISGTRNSSWENQTVRKNVRLTAFGEFYGSDFFEDDSFLAKLIGRNVVTGLVSSDERNSYKQEWMNYATGTDFANAMDASSKVDGWGRAVSFVVYLSDDLSDVSSPWDLDLPGIETSVNLSGSYSTTYFDSHWTASGVDPSAAYVKPIDNSIITQSENWQNYGGLSTMDVSVLNASGGDKNDLMSTAVKKSEILDSYALTWQGYWWDGLVVPTFGWRQDEMETWGCSGPFDSVTAVVSTDFDNPKEDTQIVKGDTVSWGVVAHTDQFLRDKLPGGTHFSIFYNSSKNFKAETRVGYSGTYLPNPEGKSEDYGIVVNTLNNRLSFKLTWFETEMTNADIGSSSPLGSNAYFIHDVETWGTAAVLAHELFWSGNLPGMAWFSNYGMADENLWGAEGWENAPFSEEALNHPSNIELQEAISDWYATMPDQSFFDAYGLPIDREKAQGTLADRKLMINNGNWNPYNDIGSIQSAGGGSINGLYPTMTCGQRSKGIEIEIQARPIDNWNISVNVSKTEATRTSLGEEITNLINSQYERFQGPAGNLRLWYAGDSTIRDYYNDYVYQAYLFQMDANGQSAAEIRPWRSNLVTNYNFVDGKLRGFNVGCAYRWQDELILGYQLDESETKMDVNRPIKGASETNIDLWAGYQKQISDKLSWRIQLNLRNVGKDAQLIPVSVNPDGAVAASRIAEGMVWSLTNTFSF